MLTNQCIHCGAWNKHASISCSTWQRCPRCRERGHTEAQCSSPLKGSTAEVPCDLCGSPNHVESECSALWKPTVQEPTATGVTVSLSCARCISASHLIGDCPSLRKPLPNSSFTLSGIDPNTITNLNTGYSSRGKPMPPKPAPPSRGPRSKNRRGPKLADPSSESDDGGMPPRGGRRPPPSPPSRGRGRGAISFGSSTFVPNQSRAKPPPRPFSGNRGPPPPRGGFKGRGRGGFKPRRGK
jgi:protein AIR1/2